METKSHGIKPKEKETKTTVRMDVMDYLRKLIFPTVTSQSQLFAVYDSVPPMLGMDHDFMIEVGRAIDEHMYHQSKIGGEHVF